MTRLFKIIAGLAIVGSLAVSNAPSASSQVAQPTSGTLLVSGLQGPVGSTIGPDGALYVAEGPAGRISRIETQSGNVTTFASGLPKMNPDVGIGGVMDVAFMGNTAYALVTLVSSDVGGKDIDGLYRIDGPNKFTVVADIGKYSLEHPPTPEFFVPTGLQYAMEVYGEKFLVTDGHHNRVLKVGLDGEITELLPFNNVVPTGLEITGGKVYMSEAGPVPHEPSDGKIVTFAPSLPTTASSVASGASLLVDVEQGPGGLYALSQGPGVPGAPAGSPSQPGTGALLIARDGGTLAPLVGNLDRPTSLEFVGDTAFVTTLAGQVWKIEDVSKLSEITPSHAGIITPPSTGDGGLVH